MKGSLRRWPDGRWQLRVYVGRNAKGNPVQRSRYFTGGKRAAEDALRKFVDEVCGSRPQLPHDATVGQLLDRWLTHIEAERTISTMVDYRQKVDKRIKPELGKTRVASLNAQKLDHVYRKWLAEGLSPATIRKQHAILAAACHQAEKWGLIDHSPTDRATLPRAETVDRGTMTATDVGNVLRLTRPVEDGDVLAVAITLAAVTGARRGELCALRWSDLNEHSATLRVARSVTVTKTEWSEGLTKTRRSRPVVLGDMTMAVFRWRREAQRSYAAAADVALVADPFILSRLADGSGPCLPDGLSLGFRRIAIKLGLPWHFHDLRHFAATIGMASGAHARTVADRLGHADPALTLRTYTHSDDSADRALAERMEGALAPSLPSG